MANRKKIVILGGGFAGLYTALRLEKTLARDPEVEVTLVNRENFFLFTPMLHEVAASDLDLTTIVNPVRKLLHRVDFFDGDVESIDLDAKKITVSHGIGTHHHHELDYDHLVIALGAVTNFYNLSGLKDRALTMKTLGDAIYLRNRMIEHLEEADFECCSALRDRLLTFVVAGGGFAGVETVAALNDFVREALAYYPHLKDDMFRIVLVHAGPVILPELGRELGMYAQQKLAQRKVEIRVNTTVKGFSDLGVQLSDGSLIQTETLVWTAGTSPNPILESLPCAKEAGRLRVNKYLQVQDWPAVWALGDCAAIPDPSNGRTYPPTAQHAVREGKTVARNIRAALRGDSMRPFTFSTLGQLAAIGRRTGVANIMGIRFSGFLAWWLWRTIYLSKLPRTEKKMRVLLDWTLDLIFSKDLVQFATLRAGALSQGQRDEAGRRTGTPPEEAETAKAKSVITAAAGGPPVEAETPSAKHGRVSS